MNCNYGMAPIDKLILFFVLSVLVAVAVMSLILEGNDSY